MDDGMTELNDSATLGKDVAVTPPNMDLSISTIFAVSSVPSSTRVGYPHSHLQSGFAPGTLRTPIPPWHKFPFSRNVNHVLSARVRRRVPTPNSPPKPNRPDR